MDERVNAEMDAEQGDGQVAPAAAAGADLAVVRELALKAHPDVVPELVQGATVEELLASIPAAEAAFRAAIARANPHVAAAVEPVAAGTPVRTQTVNPEDLSSFAKIRHGIASR